jgi:hypothetical protein
MIEAIAVIGAGIMGGIVGFIACYNFIKKGPKGERGYNGPSGQQGLMGEPGKTYEKK